MSGNILIENIGSVRVITINRPAQKNAVDHKTAMDLFHAFQAFDKDDDASVAILTGAGGAFCAGYDLKSVAEGNGIGDIDIGGENTPAPMGPTRLTLSKPIIAAIEGHAVAGGMELALWCDLRVMAQDATFGIYCRRFGVPLVDGGTFRLPRLIGQSRALDLILTGRPIQADEAERIGLANRVVPSGNSLQSAIELANSLAKFPQNCMRNDRLALLQQWGMTNDEAIRNEAEVGFKTIGTGETFKGASHFSKGKGRHGEFDD